jgi:magnesium chelatase family protein
MAVGVLEQNEDIAVRNIGTMGFIGELSLDGRLRACRGILPMIIAAKKSRASRVIVPTDNLKEARLVHGIEMEHIRSRQISCLWLQ